MKNLESACASSPLGFLPCVPRPRNSHQGKVQRLTAAQIPFFGTCNFRKMSPISNARRLETLRGHLGNPNVHAEPSSVDLRVRPKQRSCMGRNTAHVLYILAITTQGVDFSVWDLQDCAACSSVAFARPAAADTLHARTCTPKVVRW